MTQSSTTAEPGIRYVFLLAADPAAWAEADEAAMQVYVEGHAAFEAHLDAHGRRISSAPLAEAGTATTLRTAGGREELTDGPFAELVEQVCGYYDAELPDLETALAAARLLPDSYAVEIRPVADLG